MTIQSARQLGVVRSRCGHNGRDVLNALLAGHWQGAKALKIALKDCLLFIVVIVINDGAFSLSLSLLIRIFIVYTIFILLTIRISLTRGYNSRCLENVKNIPQ